VCHIGNEKIKMVCRFRNMKERDQLEDLLVDGWIILKCILSGTEGVDWINLVQERGKWLVVWKAIMELHLLYR
jgi:hypothetical protein